MDDTPDLATRQRILRRVIGQAYGLVVVLLLVGLAITPSPVPLWVRAVATLVVLLAGAGLVEVFVRFTARRYPTMHLPAVTNVIGAVIGSLLGFGLAIGVQQLLGYAVPITWTTLIEALVSAPVWIVFVGSITAARWRYLALRARLIDELVGIESARNIERDALNRARESVAASVRPSLVDLRDDIDRVLATPEPEQRSVMAESLRRSAATVVRPLSHAVYAAGDQPVAHRRPLRFLAAIVRTQPFRPLIVSALYLATALPRNVQEYGFAAALPALALDAAFIILILGGANLLMGRWRAAHAWIYIATLVIIHAIPLLLAIPGVAETDPQTSLAGTVIEIAVSLALLLGTSSLGLLRDNRDKALDALRHEVRAEELTSLAEASVLASAARELGSRLHGPVQSTVLASAAALEHAVDDASTSAVHAVLAQAAAAIDGALQGDQGPDDDVPLTTLLNDVIEPWREICPVTVALADDIGSLTGPQAIGVATIVREAIANAYRHGEASRVDASIRAEDGDLHLRVIDDGVGPGPKQWGLGLTLIDRLTGGHWTLTRERDATVLAARVTE